MKKLIAVRAIAIAMILSCLTLTVFAEGPVASGSGYTSGGSYGRASVTFNGTMVTSDKLNSFILATTQCNKELRTGVSAYLMYSRTEGGDIDQHVESEKVLITAEPVSVGLVAPTKYGAIGSSNHWVNSEDYGNFNKSILYIKGQDPVII